MLLNVYNIDVHSMDIFGYRDSVSNTIAENLTGVLSLMRMC